MNTFHVLCSTDDNFVQHCGVMIYSLFHRNCNLHFVVHVLENSLSDENKVKLFDIGRQFNQIVSFHHIGDEQTLKLKLRLNSPVSKAAYFRLYVSSVIIDPEVESVLYLDCDIIINRDISDLFRLDLKNYSIVAVRDINNPRNEEHLMNLSFSYNDRYFNSGVLMINLKSWKAHEIEIVLLSEAERIGCKFYHDQDPLNAVFRDQWMELPPSWNRFNVVKYEDVFFKNKADELEYIYNPRIIHYASPAARPWMDMKFVPWGHKYEEILALTPWKDAPKQKVEKKSRYWHLLKVKYANILYRSPLLIRITLVSLTDVLLYLFHVIKHGSLRYYSPHRIQQ